MCVVFLRHGVECCRLNTPFLKLEVIRLQLGQLSLASLRGRLIEYQLRLG